MLLFELPFLKSKNCSKPGYIFLLLKSLVIGIDCFAANVIPALMSQADLKVSRALCDQIKRNG